MTLSGDTRIWGRPRQRWSPRGGVHSSPGELRKKNLFTSGRLLLSGRFKPGCLTRSKETFFQHHEGCGKLFIHTAFTVEDHFNFLFLFTNVVHKWRLWNEKITLHSGKKKKSCTLRVFKWELKCWCWQLSPNHSAGAITQGDIWQYAESAKENVKKNSCSYKKFVEKYIYL